jgi:hypothetical protein
VVWTKKMKRLGRRYDYYCEAATRGMQQGRGGVEQEQTPSPHGAKSWVVWSGSENGFMRAVRNVETRGF